MTRSDNVVHVADLAAQLLDKKATVLTEYRGTTVQQMDDARRKFEAAGVVYKVAKNSLLKRALKEAGITPDDESVLDLPIALAIGANDEVAVAKAVASINKEIETIIPRAGILNGVYVAGSVIARLSKLPGRQELYAGLASGLASLTTKMVRTINNPLQGLVNALGQIKEQKEA